MAGTSPAMTPEKWFAIRERSLTEMKRMGSEQTKRRKCDA